jgi:peptidoglycan hydrolase-like protein with peptidoglycan-binding domain
MVKPCEEIMSYRQSMGMMYATAGIGDAALPNKPAPGMSTPANGTPEKVAHPVRAVQTALAARGFSPGAIDGVWGSQTAAAMSRAVGDITVSVSGDKRTVYILAPDWTRMINKPTVMTPGSSLPPATEPDGTPSIVGEETSYLPWVLGAGGLLAVGGYFMWKGKKKVAANRRRRRRSSRRRSRR